MQLQGMRHRLLVERCIERRSTRGEISAKCDCQGRELTKGCFDSTIQFFHMRARSCIQKREGIGCGSSAGFAPASAGVWVLKKDCLPTAGRGECHVKRTICECACVTPLYPPEFFTAIAAIMILSVFRDHLGQTSRTNSHCLDGNIPYAWIMCRSMWTCLGTPPRANLHKLQHERPPQLFRRQPKGTV